MSPGCGLTENVVVLPMGLGNWLLTILHPDGSRSDGGYRQGVGIAPWTLPG